MITHGTKKPANLHTFLLYLYEELCEMTLDGIEVDIGDEIIRAKINLLTFCGDIPAIADLINHRGHTHRNGCRMCDITGVRGSTGGMFFPKVTAWCGMNEIETYRNTVASVSKNIYGVFFIYIC
jgi:hypothetical protein